MIHNINAQSRQRHANRRPVRFRRVTAVAVAAGVLAAGCGASPSSNNPARQPLAGSEVLANAHCMRSHGVPSFPQNAPAFHAAAQKCQVNGLPLNFTQNINSH